MIVYCRFVDAKAKTTVEHYCAVLKLEFLQQLNPCLIN